MSHHKPNMAKPWPQILLSFPAFLFAPKPTPSQFFPLSVHDTPIYPFVWALYLGAKPASSLSLNSPIQPIKELCWFVFNTHPSLSMCCFRCCHPTPISAKLRNCAPSFLFPFSCILPFKSYTNSWDLASQRGDLLYLLLNHRRLDLGLQIAGAQ